MGNVESTENGRPSLAGLEAVIRDPSLILGNSPQALVIRHRLAAQASISQVPSSNIPRAIGSSIIIPSHHATNPILSTHISMNVKNQQKRAVTGRSMEGDLGNSIEEGAGQREKMQFREGEPEEFESIPPPIQFEDPITEFDDDLAVTAPILAGFVSNHGYFS